MILNIYILHSFYHLPRRPDSVCYCSNIIPEPIPIRSKIIMLQHPNEVKRCLRTTKIIELSIPSESYYLYRGKKFTQKKFPDFYKMLADPNRESILVFPSDNAESLYTLKPNIPERSDGTTKPYNIIVLDGTWSQAKVLYNTNPIMSTIRCIKLDNTQPSRYVIRTQPMENCLSTVEAVGLVLAHLESNPTIMDHFTKPLKAICDFQLIKGAVEHQSKEYMITNGLYQKPLNKRIQKSLDLNHKLHIKDLLA